MIWDQLPNNQQEVTISPHLCFCLIPVLEQTVPDLERCVNAQRRKESNSKPPICGFFPEAKQMFNQSSYRFQKSQCDKCSWKQPANRAMSDRARPQFRKHWQMTSITQEDFCSWFYFSHGGMWITRNLLFPPISSCFSSANSPSWCRRSFFFFCFYLLLHINYSNWGWQQKG